VPAFFAGLLPEGRRLSDLQRAVKTSVDDDLTLLLAVGADPVGDVQVIPHGRSPSRVTPLVQVDKSWNEVSFRELLANAGVSDMVALAGVQDKASASMLSAPVTKANLRYILKIDPIDYPCIVRDEAYFLDLARRARFPVARAEVILDRDELPGLLVERFDRVVDRTTGRVTAVAMEDAAQVMGRYPKDKYAVTAEAAVHALAGVCAAQAVALRAIFQQIVFAWLTGNGDQHAKNLSVLAAGDEWRISPAYDVPSTIAYGDRTLALSVGGRKDGLSRRSLIEFARTIGLNEKAATSVLDSVLRATAPVFDDWREGGQSPFLREQTDDTLRVLRHRRGAALGRTPAQLALS